MLLSASVERFSVSRVRDIFSFAENFLIQGKLSAAVGSILYNQLFVYSFYILFVWPTAHMVAVVVGHRTLRHVICRPGPACYPFIISKYFVQYS